MEKYEEWPTEIIEQQKKYSGILGSALIISIAINMILSYMLLMGR